MTDEKYTTIYLTIYGKILQIHLHGVIQIRGKIIIGHETVRVKNMNLSTILFLINKISSPLSVHLIEATPLDLSLSPQLTL